ncbi:unnamed protein product [Paramecium primaurelia]|uniref:Uncharacterized protein n=1 Tax=Paramecium primaurelia TaxID=5886 RepID=A0A8S1QFC5_PARPR|nr:unnamed protein product [Paramecium primaurelia]
MQKSDQLISGDRDGSIVIWSSNNNNYWNYSQKIKGRSYRIYCLILNKDEVLFISSSGDNTIKFWNKQKEWICQQSITLIILLKFIKQVQRIKKIKLFLVDRIQQYQQLNILNIVKGGWQYKISKLIFMDLDYPLQTIIVFTFKPYYGNLISLKKNIIVNQGSESCSLFQLQFIQQNQIQVSKPDTFVNFLRKIEKDEFKYEVIYSILYKQIFGQLSNYGEYFITWDSLFKDIQIWGYKQQ